MMTNIGNGKLRKKYILRETMNNNNINNNKNNNNSPTCVMFKAHELVALNTCSIVR